MALKTKAVIQRSTGLFGSVSYLQRMSSRKFVVLMLDYSSCWHERDRTFLTSAFFAFR